MDFFGYQQAAKETAIYPVGIKDLKDADENIIGLLYTALGLENEAGEVGGKVKKVLRDFGGEVTPDMRSAILKEAGDCIWYISELCRMLGADLEIVAQANIAKLADRKERGVLGGNGDKR
jgi:NTP pyrophosphatase (non-canonical NTP hydrolase)